MRRTSACQLDKRELLRFALTEQEFKLEWTKNAKIWHSSAESKQIVGRKRTNLGWLPDFHSLGTPKATYDADFCVAAPTVLFVHAVYRILPKSLRLVAFQLTNAAHTMQNQLSENNVWTPDNRRAWS